MLRPVPNFNPGATMRTRLTAALVLSLTVLSACSDTTAPPPMEPVDAVALSFGGPRFWETGAAVRWNELTDQLIARRPQNVVRLFTYLSLAQFKAAEAAEKGHGLHASTSAAIGGASVAVLRSFFPLDTTEIEAALDAQEAEGRGPAFRHQSFAAGEAIGRAIGARVNTYALGDRVNLTDPGHPPIGPGYWVWTGGPIARGFLGARTFFLASGDELRSPPPPAFGSPQYLAALAEVRQISDTRTSEQLAIAQYWNTNQSPVSDAAINGIARELIVKHHRGDREAARILFLMNASAFDALNGCFDAKYAYWFIRPPQADPLITLPIGLPPHPSYPSAHSCASGAFTKVLARAFPSERRRLQQVAEEASLSRLYAGIHYRFDMEAGLALGRAVARKALRANLDKVAVLP